MLDTGADNFVKESFLKTIDPVRSLFVYFPVQTTLGDESVITTNYMVTLYVILEPLVGNNPVGYTEPFLSFNAQVAPDCSNDLIIGDRSIHEWFLYPYIYQANCSAHQGSNERILRKLRRAQSRLATMYPVPLDGMIPLSQSILTEDVEDDEVDDCPPDTFSIITEESFDASVIDYYDVIANGAKTPADSAAKSDEVQHPSGTSIASSAVVTSVEQRSPSSDDTDDECSIFGDASVVSYSPRPSTQLSDDESSAWSNDSAWIRPLDPLQVRPPEPIEPKAPIHITSSNYKAATSKDRQYHHFANGGVFAETLDTESVDEGSDFGDDLDNMSEISYDDDEPSSSEDDYDSDSASSGDDEDDDRSVQTADLDINEIDTTFREVIMPNIYPHLSQGSYERVLKILERKKHLFSDKTRAQGAKLPPMDIKLTPGAEIPKSLRARPRLMATIIDREIAEHIAKLLELGIIEPYSKAKFWSQVLMIKHPSGKRRFCIDYRYINLISDTYHWPLPLIDNLIRSLGGKAVFSTLDLTMGFHQCRLSRRAKRLSAFTTAQGTFRYRRVPFGFSGGPSYFQRMIQEVVLKGLVPDSCLVYIDDVIIFGKDEAEHNANLEKVLQRFDDFDITIKPAKCHFLQPEVQYLGHKVSKDGVDITDERKKHIGEMRRPVIVSELHSFVGLVNFFRDHVKGFATVTIPLYEILADKKNKPKSTIQWTERSDNAWQQLKDAVANAPILHFLRPKGDIFLYTDASDQALGGHLIQVVDGIPYTVCFLSKKFAAVQSRWSTTDKELFAIVYCVLKLRAMLGGRYFTVYTDHKTLTHWNSLNDSPKVCRWKQRMTEFTFNVVHIDGIHNNVADALSRLCSGTSGPVKKRRPPTLQNIPRFFPQASIPRDDRAGSRLNKARAKAIISKALKSRSALTIRQLAAKASRILRAPSTSNKVSTRSSTKASTRVEPDQSVVDVELTNISKTVNDNSSGVSTINLAETSHIPATAEQTAQQTPQPRQPAEVRVIDKDKIAIMTQFHNDTTGHHGVNRTYSNMKEAGHNWRQMKDDVKTFVRQCLACQFVNPNTHPSNGLKFTVVQDIPFKTVMIDAMSALTGDPVFKHIIVFICAMSRLVRLYPVKTLSAEEFLPHLRSYTCQFRPLSYAVDNHKQFINEMVIDYLEEQRIGCTPATPYSHQEQSLVERAILSIRLHFEKWQQSNRSTPWSQHVPIVESILCDQHVPGTNPPASPNEIIFGRETACRLKPHINTADRISDISKYQERVIKQHHQHLQNRQASVEENNTLRDIPQFAPGSLVLITNQQRLKQFSSSRRIGPFTVIRQEGNKVIVADLLHSGLQRSVFISNVKLFIPPPQWNPDQVQQDNTFIVEAITSHRLTNRNGLVVMVKWKDYDDPTEEYISRNPSIRRTIAFIRYCNDHPDLQRFTRGIQAFTPDSD